MSDEKENVLQIEPSPITDDIHLKPVQNTSTPSVIALGLYNEVILNTKDKFNRSAAEATLKKEQVKYINELKFYLNCITEDNNSLSLEGKIELQEKLQVLRDMGIQVEDRLHFDSTRLNRLTANLDLEINNRLGESQKISQEMRIYMDEIDRIIMILAQMLKSENSAIKAASNGIKGG